MNYKVGLIVLERTGAVDELGMYTVATQLAEVLWQLPTAFGFVLFAHAAGIGTGDTRHVEERVAQSTRISVALVLLAAVVVALSADVLVRLLFGVDFAGAANIVLALLPGVLAFTAFKVINTYIAGRGSPATALILMAPTTLVNFLLASVLVTTLGATGVAVAASISYTIAAGAFVWVFKRKTNRSLGNILILQKGDVIRSIHKLLRKR